MLEQFLKNEIEGNSETLEFNDDASEAEKQAGRPDKYYDIENPISDKRAAALEETLQVD